MAIDIETYKQISDASLDTPDPKRAERNLLRLFELNHDNKRFFPYLTKISRLFAVSQFLAHYCISNPEELLSALEEIKKHVSKNFLLERANTELTTDENIEINSMMRALRFFKKRYLLRITLRYISGETDIHCSMDELTFLAEAIMSITLRWSLRLNQQRFGKPSENAVTLISLGKLGGEELNYSSDVDLIAVYDKEGGRTSGVVNPSGVKINRISSHEFYCRVIELLHKMLSHQTEDGIVYRVDLRLRPQGQKSDIALPLKAYQTYYESWGRTWERMVLIRARPIAGDAELGQAFMETVVSPFVWRETLDYTEIEEIRELKKKIDSTFVRDDIKRGYGGIRETEFFVQTFQLLYGGDKKALRTHKFFYLVQILIEMQIVPEQELITLSDNYHYLRQLEHYLQMKDDLQTHSLPASKEETEVLAKKMGFTSGADFLANLRLRRMQIKNMYNSLLGTEEDIHAETTTLLDGSLTEEELKGYLSFRRVKNPETAIMHLGKVREQMSSFKTLRERDILRRFVPQFIEKALIAESPDRALSGLQSFLTLLGEKGAHLTGIAEHRGLTDAVVKLFSLSPYLSRIFLSSQRYLDTLIEGMIIRKTFKKMEEEFRRDIQPGDGHLLDVIVEHKKAEELRLGLLFLMDILTIQNLLRYLSHLADTIIRVSLEKIDDSTGFSVLGLGKLGGREITFSSDLDIIFLSDTPVGINTAEQIIKTLTTYSDKGILYNIDVRLRPDGTKGTLVKDIEGYRNYYLKSAHPWELQALLRARPVAGDTKLAGLFMEMAKEVIRQKGTEVKREDIHEMRKKIIRELSLESEGTDIKLGPGGIEEIEFYVQFLQLHFANRFPEVLLQNTSAAINRLAKKGILNPAKRETLYNAYEYYRRLETFLRLNEEQVITEDSAITELSGIFMGHKSKKEFLTYLSKLKSRVLAAIV